MTTAKTVWVWVGKDGKGYYRAVAGNGKTIDGSQGYYSKSNAKRAAKGLYPNAKFVNGHPDS